MACNVGIHVPAYYFFSPLYTATGNNPTICPLRGRSSNNTDAPSLWMKGWPTGTKNLWESYIWEVLNVWKLKLWECKNAVNFNRKINGPKFKLFFSFLLQRVLILVRVKEGFFFNLARNGNSFHRVKENLWNLWVPNKWIILFLLGVCVDTDECYEGTDDCDKMTENCMNLAGTYECACSLGYRMSQDNESCQEDDFLMTKILNPVSIAAEENDLPWIEKYKNWLKKIKS